MRRRVACAAKGPAKTHRQPNAGLAREEECHPCYKQKHEVLIYFNIIKDNQHAANHWRCHWPATSGAAGSQLSDGATGDLPAAAEISLPFKASVLIRL